jgi:Cys-rich four helix bundle protein (predicted Tat secretion target)
MLITTAGSVAAFSLSALAQPAAKGAPAPVPAPKSEVNTALYDAARECLRAGDLCLDHCVRSLSTGDKMMAECAGTVRAMLPTCAAISQLALLKSDHLKEMAAVCAKICRDCEAACKKHANHHAECKACMESCQKCATECEKAAA